MRPPIDLSIILIIFIVYDKKTKLGWADVFPEDIRNKCAKVKLRAKSFKIVGQKQDPEETFKILSCI